MKSFGVLAALLTVFALSGPNAMATTVKNKNAVQSKAAQKQALPAPPSAAGKSGHARSKKTTANKRKSHSSRAKIASRAKAGARTTKKAQAKVVKM